jgi:hypothetical protein
MNLAHALPQDELLLAQLTASKLAKVMHGLMSVGTGSLEMASPTDFLSGRDKVPLGFLEVLRCIGVKPGHTDKIEVLRQQVDQLSELTSRFYTVFMELAHWRSMSREDVRQTADRLVVSYTEYLQRLGAFCSMLGMDPDYSAKAQIGRFGIDSFLRTLETTP